MSEHDDRMKEHEYLWESGSEYVLLGRREKNSSDPCEGLSIFHPKHQTVRLIEDELLAKALVKRMLQEGVTVVDPETIDWTVPHPHSLVDPEEIIDVDKLFASDMIFPERKDKDKESG